MSRVKLLIVGMFLMLEAAISQVPPDSSNYFSLNVHLNDKKIRRLILLYPSIMDGSFIRDTVICSETKASFSGFAKEPSLSHLIDPDVEENRISFFIEPGKLDIYVNKDTFQNSILIGSSSQDEWINHNKKNIDLQTEAERLSSILRKLNNNSKTIRDTALLVNYKEQIKVVSSQIDSINGAFARKKFFYIQEHINSYISSTLLYGLLVNRQIESKTAGNLYSKLSPEVQRARVGKLIVAELQQRETGKLAASFTATDRYNNKIVLSELRGKHVLLNFWASWCSPCIDKIPGLLSLYNQYHENGFEIINISIDSKKDSWVKAIKKYNVGVWKNLLALDNPTLSAIYPNIMRPIPSEILIDGNGVVIWNSDNKNLLKLDEALALSIKE